MAKRTLHRPQAATVSCLACNWRQYSNKSFKELLKMEGNTLPADFSGILVGLVQGSITIVNFQGGKQIGYAPIPLGAVEHVMARASEIYDNEITALMERIKAEHPELAEQVAEEMAEELESEIEDAEEQLAEVNDVLDELRELVSEELEEDDA